MSAVAVTDDDPTSTTLSTPQFCAAVPVGQPIPGGVPTTKSVLPDSSPIVAPPMTPALTRGIGVPGDCVPKLSGTMLAFDVPPHSTPQLKMYAVVPLPLKTPQTGRPKPFTVQSAPSTAVHTTTL